MFDKIRPLYLPWITFPEPESEWKKAILENILESDIVIEVGSNRGGSTFLLTSKAKFVFGFEPGKSNFNILRAFARHAKLTNLKIENIAIGDTEGEAEFFLSDDRGGYRNSMTPATGGKIERVRINSLDNLSLNPKPTVLLMDCEGAETSILGHLLEPYTL